MRPYRFRKACSVNPTMEPAPINIPHVPHSPQEEALRFDRILADVPCSGDGTMRKAPDIWRRWSVATGNGLHLMQLRIALQGCKLLKVRQGAMAISVGWVWYKCSCVVQVYNQSVHKDCGAKQSSIH